MILNFNKFHRLTLLRRDVNNLLRLLNCRFVSYVQGQSPQPGIREYFYYIDHQGMLFLDDTRIKNFTSCFKDKQFLKFFFSRLRMNNSEHYKDSFPYISLCGKERNFVRCDDLPIVFTHVVQIKSQQDDQQIDYFCYGHADDLLKVLFEPNKVIMEPHSGRIYHPAPALVGGIGLIKSSLAIEFSNFFKFEDGEEKSPTQFCWRNKWYRIDNAWYKELIKK